MRLFTLVIVGLCAFATVSYADSRSDYYQECMKYRKSDGFCTCAVGEPYDALMAENTVSTNQSSLMTQLEDAERQYQAAYDHELERGGITPSQLDMVCQVVEEYYNFLDSIDVDYKSAMTSTGKKSHGFVPSSSEDRQAMMLKRKELSQRIHHLNHDFQSNGAYGALSSLGSGTCVMELRVKWLQERLARESQANPKEAEVTPSFPIKKLISRAYKACSGRL
ncbi:MAG: hypothetical protein ACTHOO_09090 [Alcanivorax sp.]